MYRERNPMAICLKTILAVSVFQTAFFLEPLPPSLAQSPILGRACAIILFIGCVGSVVGILWRDHDRSLLIEQFFIAIAALGFVGYAVALAQAQPFSSAAFAFGMSLGIGVFCVLRFIQIQRYIGRRRRIAGRARAEDGP